MPIIESPKYSPSFLFKNAHINTIYPYFFRKINHPGYQRKRIKTLDDDFIDLDLICNNHNKVAILCHGLEGSCHSQYMLSSSAILSSNGYDIIGINFRSCGEEMNNEIRSYHSGETSDLNFVIQQHKNKYNAIFLIGFSLGGNVVAKYVGEQSSNLDSKIKAVVSVSTPCQLDGGANEIIKLKNLQYERKFLSSLTKKMKLKHLKHGDNIPIADLKKVKNLIDFDEYFTSRLHGFDGAMDYYLKCSCRQFLPDIKTPTLILTAQDDPFLGETCYPYEEARNSEFVFLHVPKYGGHVGFVDKKTEYYWSDYAILNWLNNNSN